MSDRPVVHTQVGYGNPAYECGFAFHMPVRTRRERAGLLREKRGLSG